MNKLSSIIIALLLCLQPFFSFAQEKPWKEMENFHEFMASAFHPAEEGNLEPLKQKADSLYLAAREWNKSEIPSNYKEKETKVNLAKLEKKCRQLKNMVLEKATDQALKKVISDAHNTFHKIIGECRKP